MDLNELEHGESVILGCLAEQTGPVDVGELLNCAIETVSASTARAAVWSLADDQRIRVLPDRTVEVEHQAFSAGSIS